MYDFDQHRKSLKNWLLGRDYFVALKALRMAKERHTGLRKDKKTPEFMHQVTLAQHARTLEKSLVYPEETIAVLLLHDVPEDKVEGRFLVEKEYPPLVVQGTMRMTKFYYPNYKMEKSDEHYYGELAECPIGSIAKAIDRCHNIQTMLGVFSQEKQVRYVDEVEEFILPMLSRARENFPEQDSAYHNVKHTLLCQIELIRALHAESAGSQNGKV